MRKRKSRQNFQISNLFLSVALLMVFSVAINKAQNNSPDKCGKWRDVWELQAENRFNGSTGKSEVVLVNKLVKKFVNDCEPSQVSSNQNKTAKELYKEGSSLVSEGTSAILNNNFIEAQKKFVEAEKKLTAAINLDSDAHDAYSSRAWVRLQLGYYRESIEDSNRVMQLYSAFKADKTKATTAAGFNEYVIYNPPADLLRRGMAKVLLGDKSGAFEDFRNACNFSKENPCKYTAISKDDYCKVVLACRGKSEVSSNSPITGTWKYTEYYQLPSYAPPSISPEIKSIVTLVFYKDGWVEVKTETPKTLLGTTERLNWRYTPQNNKAGFLEFIKDGTVTFKKTIKWINDNKFEYENNVVWTRQ